MKSTRRLNRWTAALRALVHARARDDRGVALVTVIGAAMVVGIVAAIVVATTSTTVRTTTVTRSEVQSKAAAEAGVAYVQSVIADGSCVASPSGVVSPASMPTFTAEVYWASTGTATTSSTAGCPPASAASVLVRSTGTADSAGIGDARNNTNTVEALFSYATVPAFNLNKAVFTGTNMTFNNLAKVLRDPSAPGVPADVYAGGAQYTCNAGSEIQGSVYLRGGDNPAYGAFENQNGACTITGDLVSRADVRCFGGMTVGGNLYTQRRVELMSNGCKIAGNIGSVGNFDSTGGYSAGGNVRVNGDYKQANSSVTVGGKVYIAGSKHFSTGWESANPGKVVHPAAPTSVPSIPDEPFPHLDDAWINANFAGWARPGWKATLEPVRNAGKSWVNVCLMGSNGTMGTLTITQNTVLDARSDCGSTLQIGGSLTISLKADLAIVSTHLNKTGDLQIVSGDGAEHEVYFIAPWDNSKPQCDSSGSAMVWGWGNHTQPDGRTRAFFYAPNGFKTENSHKIRGQIYACHATFSTDQEITYAPVSGLGGASVGGPGGLTMIYQKDVS